MTFSVKTDRCWLDPDKLLPVKKTLSAYIFDLIATAWIITQISETFDELAIKIFNLIPVGYSRMDIVADTYRNKSIKRER